ncbi:hypothetical protein EF405_12340 [Cyclobacteriaceae bacterium YHN15]|nr:hypothetical protein EF405_12340 [Cyclobacteriaceae bacterium YHN15]
MNAINEILAPANWELTAPKEKLFSSDHVIDAYLKGKNHGLEQQQRLILEKLISNINKAGKDTSAILSFLKKKKLNPIAAYLRINSWDDFSILIILPQDEFLDKRMLRVYDFISDLESRVGDDMYNIQVTVCDTEDKIDENYVRSDGFAFKHKVS